MLSRQTARLPAASRNATRACSSTVLPRTDRADYLEPTSAAMEQGRSCIVTPGVWVAPGTLAQETRQTLERRGLAAYVDIFTGNHFAFGDLASKVRTWWDLDELTELYTDFLGRYSSVLESLSPHGTTPLEACRVYDPMLTQCRRLPYRDPGPPLAFLPPEWIGVEAGSLFDRLQAALSTPAQQHADEVIHGAS